MSTEKLPEVAKAGQLADQSYEIALAVKIDSSEMYAYAGEELRSIVTRRKQIEELRLSITRPMDEAKKNAIAAFAPALDRLSQGESLLRDEMTAYQRAEQAKADAARRAAEDLARAEREEQARQQREAEAAERQAREAADEARRSGNAEAAAIAEAAASKAAEQAEEAQQQVELAQIAPPMSIATFAPKAAGISSRKNWKAEVTDLRALVLAAAKRAEAGDDFLISFLTADTKVIGSAAKAMQAKLNVPGVRVYAEDVLSVRRA